MKGQRRKKKAVPMIVAGMLFLSLAGCGSREDAGVQEPLAESAQSAQAETQESLSADEENRPSVEDWADAWVRRDGAAIVSMSSEAVQEALEDGELLFREGDTDTFGWSSPWPGDDYRLEEVTDNTAVILYYARTSDPHVTVWRESLTWHREAEGIVVEAQELEMMRAICSGEEYVRAYPNGVEHTPMDYLESGMGEALNQNALQNRENVSYSGLFAPEMAVIQQLNLLDNPEKVKVETVPDTRSDRVFVNITFTGDGSTLQVSAVRPYGGDGIWIVQDSGAVLE